VFNILGNTLCWALLEDLFTQNTVKYLMLSTDEDLFTQNTEKYFMLNTVGRFLPTVFNRKYFPVLCINKSSSVLNIRYFSVFCVNKSSNSAQHKVFPRILLRNTRCWTLGIIINTKYWDVLSIEHCGKVYLLKMLGNTFYVHKIHGNTLLNTVGNLPTVFNIKHFPVFCVRKSSHSAQHKVFPRILLR
jgi:hypothetical protein